MRGCTRKGGGGKLFQDHLWKTRTRHHCCRVKYPKREARGNACCKQSRAGEPLAFELHRTLGLEPPELSCRFLGICLTPPPPPPARPRAFRVTQERGGKKNKTKSWAEIKSITLVFIPLVCPLSNSERFFHAKKKILSCLDIYLGNSLKR